MSVLKFKREIPDLQPADILDPEYRDQVEALRTILFSIIESGDYASLTPMQVFNFRSLVPTLPKDLRWHCNSETVIRHLHNYCAERVKQEERNLSA